MIMRKALLKGFPLICYWVVATVPLQPCLPLSGLSAGYHGDGVQCILGAKSALCHIQAAGNRTSENWAASVEVECKSNCLEI